MRRLSCGSLNAFHQSAVSGPAVWKPGWAAALFTTCVSAGRNSAAGGGAWGGSGAQPAAARTASAAQRRYCGKPNGDCTLAAAFSFDAAQ